MDGAMLRMRMKQSLGSTCAGWPTSPFSMPSLSNRRCPQGGLTTVKSGTSESSHFAALPARSRRLAVTPAAVASRHARSSAPLCTSQPTARPSQGRVAAFADLCSEEHIASFRICRTIKDMSLSTVANLNLTPSAIDFIDFRWISGSHGCCHAGCRDTTSRSAAAWCSYATSALDCDQVLPWLVQSLDKSL